MSHGLSRCRRLVRHLQTRSFTAAASSTASLSSHGRYPYSPISSRTPYSWPKGRKLAVYIAINLEHFEFGRGLGAQLGAPPPAGSTEPDVLNYAWRDYGNRVGVWRMLDLLDDLELPSSVLANSSMYDYCPEVIDAFRKRGDEILAHGRTNSERQGTMAPSDEEALIKESTERIQRHEGKHPRGWLGPWISQSNVTPELLAKCGYSFMLDWCHDDQPTYFQCDPSVSGGKDRILSIPYQQEINDIPAVVARKASAQEFGNDIIAAFEEYLRQVCELNAHTDILSPSAAAKGPSSNFFGELQEQSRSVFNAYHKKEDAHPLVYGIALHPYIVGQPHRLFHLRRALLHIIQRIKDHEDIVWVTKAGDIASYVETLPDGVVP